VSGLTRAVRSVWSRFAIAIGGEAAKQKMLRRAGVHIGHHCRIYTDHFGSEPYLIFIGNHCTITSGVRFVTHDGSCWILREQYPHLQDYGPIRVEDNSFVGVNAVILPNVRIGPNAIVAAGAVVTKNVDPGTVVGGIPARVLMSVEEFGKRKLARVGDLRVPTDLEERRNFLVKKFADWLDR